MTGKVEADLEQADYQAWATSYLARTMQLQEFATEGDLAVAAKRK